VTTVLFIAGRDSSQKLAEVAAHVYEAPAIVESEERFSSNYPPDEHYFVGYAENVVVKVYDADDDTKPEYRFRLALSPPRWRKGSKLAISDPVMIAETLARAGLKTFIPSGQWSRTDWDGKGKEYAV